jgi:invasion protein IalB
MSRSRPDLASDRSPGRGNRSDARCEPLRHACLFVYEKPSRPKSDVGASSLFEAGTEPLFVLSTTEPGKPMMQYPSRRSPRSLFRFDGRARTWLVALSLASIAALAGFADVAQAQQAKTTQYKDWAVVCPQTGGCIATHQPKGMRILVGKDQKSGKLRAAILVAADTKKGSPVSVWLDTDTTIELVISDCQEKLCEAAVAVDQTPAVLNAFKKASKGLVAYLAGERIRMIQFSLSGSSAAINAVGG